MCIQSNGPMGKIINRQIDKREYSLLDKWENGQQKNGQFENGQFENGQFEKWTI